MGKLENYDTINELLNLVFNTNIVIYPSIGLVLYCMQKAGIAHHWCTEISFSESHRIISVNYICIGLNIFMCNQYCISGEEKECLEPMVFEVTKLTLYSNEKNICN